MSDRPRKVCPRCEYEIAGRVISPCPECGATIIVAATRPRPELDWTIWLAAAVTIFPSGILTALVLSMVWGGVFGDAGWIAVCLIALVASPVVAVWGGMATRRRRLVEVGALVTVLLAALVFVGVVMTAVMTIGASMLPGLVVVVLAGGGACGAALLGSAMRHWQACEGRAIPPRSQGAAERR